MRTVRNRRTRYAASIALTLVIGLAMFLSLPATVQAADPIVLGDGVDTGGEAWSVEDIKPCMSGSETQRLATL